MKSVINVAVPFATLITITLCTVPDYITVCPHDHPNLPRCIINSIELLRPRLKEGIKELGIPSLEHLELGHIVLDRIGETSRLATNLSEIVVNGASNFTILQLNHTLTKHGRNFYFNVTVPTLYIKGICEIDSRLIFLDLKGRGPFHLNITDLYFVCALKGKVAKEEKVSHIIFDKMKCDATFGKANILLENLFNGQEVLGKATNDVLNDNIDILAEEIKPALIKTVSERFTDIANKITLAFDYKELFP